MRLGIEQLKLHNFRSYEDLTLSFDKALPPVVLTGGNGAGKTNILEAVSFLVPGRGLRNARLYDVARQVAGEGACENWAVSAAVRSPNGIVQVGTGKTDASERRQIRIDGQNAKTQGELGSVLSALWLTPAMDRLFCGDPASRRRFLDRLVQAFDAGHANLSSDYAYAFKQWSNLLHEGRIHDSWLTALEDTIASKGVAIAAARRDIVSRLSVFLSQKVDDLFPTARIHLNGLLEGWLDEMSALDAEEQYREKLRLSRPLYANGSNVEGVHTSDFNVIYEEKGMDAGLCSTGEQKALLVSIILAQTKAAFQEKGQCPILLFDEVGAHLDAEKQRALFRYLLSLPTQVWFTGTEAKMFEPLYQDAEFFNIENASAQLLKVA